MSRKFLYRRLGVAVIVILVFCAAAIPVGLAQGTPQLKRPQQTDEEKPAETKRPVKKVKGPRAVGLLQFGSGGKTTLIPVAILVEGKFYDAGAYKAEPVPMALESGTVYEAEQTGESEGLFTINGALHSQNPGSVHPWLGAGSYLPHGTEAPKTTRRAENVPLGMDSSGDEPPRLTRKHTTTSDSTAPSASGSSAGPATPQKPGTSAPSEPAKPSGDSSAGTGASKPTNPSAADKIPNSGTKEQTPASQEKSSDQAAAASKPPAQPEENYYRPALRRGKPTQSAPVEEETVITAPKTGSPSTPTSAAKEETARLVPAVSDAGGPDPQTYKFFWKEGEEEERRQQMLALAGDEVRAYISARAKGVISAKPPAKTTVARKATVKPVQPVLENVQFRGFDVWKNNQPVMILTAEAHLPITPADSTAPESYSITMAARTDIYGSLRKLYSGVTDKFHLDVTPRLELIDAVDADGDGRGEFLFRETTDAGTGYVIYRPTADKLWKMFDSLGS